MSYHTKAETQVRDAAPDMAEALKALIKASFESNGDDISMRAIIAAEEMGRAALAKAGL